MQDGHSSTDCMHSCPGESGSFLGTQYGLLGIASGGSCGTGRLLGSQSDMTSYPDRGVSFWYLKNHSGAERGFIF